MSLPAGALLGPYEIVAPIGSGGMGEVYRARDRRLGRDVALKVLPRELAEDAARRQRFEQEARAVAALNHPNIVAIYDIGENYFVQELVDGEPLPDDKPVGLRRTIELAGQIADALAAAHARGITHRDLKPSNIMVTRDGRAKILDFGIAKVSQGADGQELSTLTHEGSVLGTLGHMSPEQMRGLPSDHRSDIFSFGLLLYKMLTGRSPFAGKTAIEIVSAMLRDEPQELPAEVPPALRQIVSHCLEKNPENRFQSARDLAFALQTLSGSTTGSRFVAPAVRKKGRLVAWPAVAALALACAAAGIWLGKMLFQQAPPSFTRLTFQRGFVTGARFAPDGRTVAYSATWDGAPSDVYLGRIESPDARPLGLTGAHLFAISSKGEMAIGLDAILGAVPGIPPRGTLARAPLSGGAPRVLLADVEDADWDPAGAELAVAHVVNGVARLEYPAGKVLYETAGYIDSVRVSPAGDRIAFAEHPLRNDDRGSVSVVDLHGRKTTVSSGWETLDGVAWAPGGKDLWFVGSTQGYADTLWATTLSGHRRALMRAPTGCFLRDVRSDGRALVDSYISRNEIVWQQDGDSRQRSLTWLTDSFPNDLSPDGKTLVFTEPALSSNYAVCLRKTDGSAVVRLGDGEGESLSADGKWVLTTLLTSPPQLLLIPTGAGETVRLPQAGLSYQRFAQWFPDSRRILFAAGEAGRGPRLWVQNVWPPDRPRAFTGEGMSLRGNSVSPDGRMVAATGPGGRVALYPVDGGQPRTFPAIEPGEQFIRWSADGRQLFLYTAYRMPATLYKVDAASGLKQKWREFTPSDPAGATTLYAVFLSADTKAGVYSFQRTESSLKLMEGLH